MAIHLDERAARTDLTSRECSKLISGMLFSCLALFGEDAIAEVLSYLSESELVWDVFECAQRGEPNRLLTERAKKERAERFGTEMNASSACELILGAVVGGLAGMAKKEDVKIALKWILENQDELLKLIVGKVDDLHRV